jgi:hypothetical protein
MGNPLAAPHQVLQGEKPDDQWSPAATQALRDYLDANFGGQLEFPLVDCRTDICEIQAATLGPDQDDEAMRFRDAVSGMPQLPWWQSFGFGPPTFAINGQDHDRTLMIVFISRET